MKLPRGVRGVRGVRSALARASRWNSVDGYVLHADEEICVLVQHADVLAAIDDGIAAVLKAGKAPGILATDPVAAKRCLMAGTLFVGVGLDTTLLAASARTLAASFRRVS